VDFGKLLAVEALMETVAFVLVLELDILDMAFVVGVVEEMHRDKDTLAIAGVGSRDLLSGKFAAVAEADRPYSPVLGRDWMFPLDEPPEVDSVPADGQKELTLIGLARVTVLQFAVG